MARKTRKRTRDVPHPTRDREFREGRGKSRGRYGRSNRAVIIGGKNFNAEPKRPPILFLYEDLADLEAPPAVFGMYPRNFIDRILPWMRCDRRQIVHVCSGALPRGEGIRVDVRPEALPDIVADGRALPFATGSVAGLLLDPPYTPQYAKDLYGTDYPRPAHLLAEAARVARPGARIGFVHDITPNPPPGCRVVKVFGVSSGFGFPMRAATFYEKEQAGLFGATP